MAVLEARPIAQANVGTSEYYLFQDNGNIKYRFRSRKGESLSTPVFVGAAKQGSLATLTVSGDKRVVLALGEGDVLQNFVYDAAEDEWAPGDLASAKAAVRNDAEFSGTFDSSGQFHVVAVAKSGEIVTVSANAGGNFGPAKKLSATKPAENTSVFAVVVDNAVSAFYTHADSSIHKLTLINGEWQDSQIEKTNDGGKKFNVAAVAKADGGYTLQYANDKKELFSLSGDGKLVKLGDITSDGIKKTSDAQAWAYSEEVIIRRTWWWY